MTKKGALLSAVLVAIVVGLAWCVITAGVTTAFDEAGEGSRSASWLPQSSRGLALKAENLAAVGDDIAAREAARDALRRSPLEAGALRVLAMSFAIEGRTNTATGLMRQAARVNPRDSQTQAWLFQAALGRQDYGQAMVNADNLMRRADDIRRSLAFSILPLLGNEGGRQAMAARLAYSPPWREPFLSVMGRYGSTEGLGSLFILMKTGRAPITDTEASPVFWRLITAGDYQAARNLFDALVGPENARRKLVYDGGFDGLSGAAPLNWDILTVPGGDAVFKIPNGAALGHLRLRHDGFSTPDPMVRQLVFLPPGSYAMSARARIDEPEGDERFRVDVVCTSGVKLASLGLKGEVGRWRQSGAVFERPSTDCDAQWLLFVPNTGDRRQPAEVQIDDLDIRPSAARPPSA